MAVGPLKFNTINVLELDINFKKKAMKTTSANCFLVFKSVIWKFSKWRSLPTKKTPTGILGPFLNI